MKAVRVTDVTFDPSTEMYKATVTLSGPHPLRMTDVHVPGHRTWTASQVIAALKNRAEA
ncbi:MAG: hypothetical protein AAGH17_05125 [Pseudomonadota bacterium]